MYEPLSRPDVPSWAERRESVARVLRETDADVIGLQETSAAQLGFLARNLQGYEAITHRVRVPEPLLSQLRARYGPSLEQEIAEVAMLVRHATLSVRETRHWWLSPEPTKELSTGFGKNVPRLAVSVRAVHRATGLSLSMTTTHVDRTAPFEQSSVCRTMMQKGAVDRAAMLLFGDLNSDVDERVIEAFLADGWRDACAGSRLATWIGDPNTSPARIDHVLFQSASLAVSDCSMLSSDGKALLSDHRPVRVRFAIVS